MLAYCLRCPWLFGLVIDPALHYCSFLRFFLSFIVCFSPYRMFNSGTNLIFELIENNCYNPARTAIYGKNAPGIRWQVPWGKHSPASYRLVHWATKNLGINPLNVLPVVVTKDPYTWMQSLCRHPYSARWKRTKQHCPNLVPNDLDQLHGFVRDIAHEEELKRDGIPVTIKYSLDATAYSNMVGAWNTWYGDFFDVEYPRVIIRFEDLLLHTEEVVTQVCHCFGGKRYDENNFMYISDSAKGEKGPHKGSGGLTEALLRYTNADNRVKAFTNDDLVFANGHLNRTMMEMLHYTITPS